MSIRFKEQLTIAEIAQRFGVDVSTVARWLKCPEHKIYTRTKFRKLDLALLIADVEAYPDAYQAERAKRLGVHQNTIFYLLKKLNITYSETSEKWIPIFAGFAISGRKQTQSDESQIKLFTKYSNTYFESFSFGLAISAVFMRLY